jgi:hypothetical protein
LVREHLPGDDRHAASHDRDGVVGAFAAEALLAVERAEVIGAQSGEREVVRFWRLGMGVFFGGSSSPEKAKSTSSVSGFSSF